MIFFATVAPITKLSTRTIPHNPKVVNDCHPEIQVLTFLLEDDTQLAGLSLSGAPVWRNSVH